MKKTKRVKRTILELEDNDPYKQFAPHMYFPFESNKECAVMIYCPTHKTAKDLIKQLLKDQKDLVRVKKQLKEYRDKEKREFERLSAHMKWQDEQNKNNRPDYNCPG